jgi:hypothetical protein
MTLLYTPFIDPINIHQYWYLFLFPLALGVSVAYKAVRIPDIKLLPRHALTMTAQIVLAMIALGAASYLFVQHIVPLIAPK